MATEASGNTTPSALKSRAFLFTINEIEQWPKLQQLLENLKSCDYVIASHENAPTTGHEHIHCYAHFSTPYRLSQRFFNLRIHVDKCRGTPKQCIDYVSKDGDIIYERGEKPHQGQALTVGDLMEIDDPKCLSWNQLHVWNQLHPQKIKKSEWHKDVKVYYIYGPSGIGKSLKAQELADDEFDEVKFVNGFYVGISDGTGCCIYDDFRPSQMPAAEFINFIDYNVHNLNVKGGNVKNKYTKIIITSIISPHLIYNNMPEEAKQQWLRRIECINLSPGKIDLDC